jgi:alginate O-acetyltransferase complex protein AlgI
MTGWAFNGYAFWCFLGVFLLCYWACPTRLRRWVLLAGSYTFYASWDWRFLGLILFSTTLDYKVAQWIRIVTSPKRKRLLLALSLTTNLGILAYFKYSEFFVGQLMALLPATGVVLSPIALRLIVPAGISFYTFTTMGYVIEVYRGTIEPTNRFPDQALFIAFFPKLVAGPIERAGKLLPQFASSPRVNGEDIEAGAWFVLWGLFSKLVVADNMAFIADGIFAKGPALSTGPECWVAAYACALQIYGDFWGYSAIALGVSRWLGLRITLNFRMPYFSKNPSEFWSRWHISLSTWLRDFIYLPLNYSLLRRLGTRRWLGLGEEYWSYFAATLGTMLLAGLWHGAGWTYILWGLFFGVLLCGHRAFLGLSRRFRLRRLRSARLSAVVRTLLMFHAACIGWVLFRAESVGQALGLLRTMFSNVTITSVVGYGLGMMALLAGPPALLEFWIMQSGEECNLLRAPWLARALTYSYALLMILVFSSGRHNEFIYFRF